MKTYTKKEVKKLLEEMKQATIEASADQMCILLENNTNMGISIVREIIRRGFMKDVNNKLLEKELIT